MSERRKKGMFHLYALVSRSLYRLIGNLFYCTIRNVLLDKLPVDICPHKNGRSVFSLIRLVDLLYQCRLFIFLLTKTYQLGTYFEFEASSTFVLVKRVGGAGGRRKKR